MNVIGAALGLLAINLSQHYEPKNIKVFDEASGVLVSLPSGIEPNIERYARYLTDFNMGTMRSLQANPDDLGTSCVGKTWQTNMLLEEMFNASTYTDSTFNQQEFLDKFQTMNIQAMDQFEKCGANTLMMVLDSGMSNLPSTVGSLMSTVTQTAIGWSAGDTALFIAKNEVSDSWDKSDWVGMGRGIGLGVSQILKHEAPAASVEVSPT